MNNSGEYTLTMILTTEKKMAHVISDECIACGSCAGVCPTEAISEGDGKFVIDSGTCIDCGTCVDECPVNAISGS